MQSEHSDDRLIFKLEADGLFDLDEIGAGFTALAHQFRRYLIERGVKPDDVPSKLLVTDLKSGSIELEVAAHMVAAYPAIFPFIYHGVIWTEFFERIAHAMHYLTGGTSKRPDNFDLVDASDFNAFLSAVMGKKSAKLGVKRAVFRKTEGDRQITASLEFDDKALSTAGMTLARELSASPTPSVPKSASITTERNAPFIWFRTDREKGRPAGQTSDRGIVAKISEKPLPVYFASEVDSLKDQMTKIKSNPFDLIYVVDVAVEHGERGEPKAYTILNIHKIIDAAAEGRSGN